LHFKSTVKFLPHLELLLHHLEPSLPHLEPSLPHLEPSLLHLEPSLHHQEPSLHHQEPSPPFQRLDLELPHQLELPQSPILNHPLQSTSTTFARDTSKQFAHNGKMPPDSLSIDSDFTIPFKDQESSIDSQSMLSML
jgi:hypothetical protein